MSLKEKQGIVGINFWKILEELFLEGSIRDQIRITVLKKVRLKENGLIVVREFPDFKNVLIILFSGVHTMYHERLLKENRISPGEKPIRLYLKSQPYFIGLLPTESFDNKRTSGYAFDYDMMERDLGVVLYA